MCGGAWGEPQGTHTPGHPWPPRLPQSQCAQPYVLPSCHLCRDVLPPLGACALAAFSHRNAFVIIQWLSVFGDILTGDYQVAFLFARHKRYSEIIRYL